MPPPYDERTFGQKAGNFAKNWVVRPGVVVLLGTFVANMGGCTVDYVNTVPGGEMVEYVKSEKSAKSKTTAKPSKSPKPKATAKKTTGPEDEEEPGEPTEDPSPAPSSGSTGETKSADATVVAVVGDICDPGCKEVAGILQTMTDSPEGLDVIATAGDNQYEKGTIKEFNAHFDVDLGKFKKKIKPSPGNHEYKDGNGDGYYEYFGVPPFYKSSYPGVDLFSLNSEIDAATDSKQNQWFKNELKNSTAKCKIAYWHQPRFTISDNHGNANFMGPIFTTAFNGGVSMVWTGHNHDYERSVKTNASNKPVPDGVLHIVQGLGGADPYGLKGGKHDTIAKAFTGKQAGVAVLKVIIDKDGAYTGALMNTKGKAIDTFEGNCDNNRKAA